jgi:ubiquinol-cytochrome c reductase iron-sulfur subunit/rieske iron-sulfur protein
MVQRRSVLVGMAAVAAAGLTGGSASAQEAKTMAPQVGDILVRASGKDMTPLKPDDIVLDARPINAWPADPATGLPRDGTLFNLLLLSRWNPAEMTADAQANAVDGVIANTVICTHAGCEITDWVEDQKILECPCHLSRFNLRQNGAVAQGPAARKLPALGLALSGANIVVAKTFDGRLGGDAE